MEKRSFEKRTKIALRSENSCFNARIHLFYNNICFLIELCDSGLTCSTSKKRRERKYSRIFSFLFFCFVLFCTKRNVYSKSIFACSPRTVLIHKC